MTTKPMKHLVARALTILAACTLPAAALLAQEATEQTPAKEGSQAAVKASPSPDASPKVKKEKRTGPIPFKGTVQSVDKAAKSFTVKGKKKERTFQVTDASKITKADNSAASIDDLQAGVQIRGSAIRNEAKTFDVVSLIIGADSAAAASPDSATADE
jgi:hypothetical protein